MSRRNLVLVESGGDCTLNTVQRIKTALGLEMQAHVPQRPTLDDVTRENERLFAELRGIKTHLPGHW